MPVSKRGSTYLMRAMIEGKRVSGTFKTSQDAEAFELACRLAAKRGEPFPSPVDGSTKTSQSIEAHYRAVAAKVWAGRKSEGKLTANARKFVEHVGPRVSVVNALTQANVDTYVSDLKLSGLNGSTVNRRLAAISVLLREAGPLATAPDLPWQRQGEARLRFFNQSEADEIFAECRRLGHPQYAKLFEFLYDTGARVGEAEGLLATDIADGFAVFRDTKNGDTRRVPLTKRAKAAASEPSTGLAFPWFTRHTLRLVWGKLRSGLPWMGDDTVPHTFRHSCASRLVQAGHDLYWVQRWMGHKSISVTQRYAHLSPRTFGAMAASLEKPIDIPR